MTRPPARRLLVVLLVMLVALAILAHLGGTDAHTGNLIALGACLAFLAVAAFGLVTEPIGRVGVSSMRASGASIPARRRRIAVAGTQPGPGAPLRE